MTIGEVLACGVAWLAAGIYFYQFLTHEDARAEARRQRQSDPWTLR